MFNSFSSFWSKQLQKHMQQPGKWAEGCSRAAEYAEVGHQAMGWLLKVSTHPEHRTLLPWVRPSNFTIMKLWPRALCLIPGRNKLQNISLCFPKSMAGVCAHQVFKEAGDDLEDQCHTYLIHGNHTALWCTDVMSRKSLCSALISQLCICLQ